MLGDSAGDCTFHRPLLLTERPFMLVGFALVPSSGVVLQVNDTSRPSADHNVYRQLAISQRVTIKHGKDARIIHTYIYSKALSNFHG